MVSLLLQILELAPEETWAEGCELLLELVESLNESLDQQHRAGFEEGYARRFLEGCPDVLADSPRCGRTDPGDAGRQ